jgi:hypothetical protein
MAQKADENCSSSLRAYKADNEVSQKQNTSLQYEVK